MADSACNSQRRLAACRAWLIVGFSGASAVAAGLLQLFDGEWLSALTLAVSGAMLATVSWRRSRSVLEQAKRVSTIAADAPHDTASRTLQTYRTRRDNQVASFPDATRPGPQ